MNKNDNSVLFAYIRESVRQALNEKKKVKNDPPGFTPGPDDPDYSQGRSMSPEDREAEKSWSTGLSPKKPGELQQYGFSASPKVSKKGELIPITPEEFYSSAPLDMPQSQGPTGFETDVYAYKPKPEDQELPGIRRGIIRKTAGDVGDKQRRPFKPFGKKERVNIRKFFTGTRKSKDGTGLIKTVEIYVPPSGQSEKTYSEMDRSSWGHNKKEFREGTDIVNIHRKRFERVGTRYFGNKSKLGFTTVNSDYGSDEEYELAGRKNIFNSIDPRDRNQFFDDEGNWNQDLFGPMPKSLSFDGNTVYSDSSYSVELGGNVQRITAQYSMSTADHEKMLGFYNEKLKGSGRMSIEQRAVENKKIKTYNASLLKQLKEKYGKKTVVVPRWTPETKKQDFQKAEELLRNKFKEMKSDESDFTGLSPVQLGEVEWMNMKKKDGTLKKIATQLRQNRREEKIVVPQKYLNNAPFKLTLRNKEEVRDSLEYNKAQAALKKDIHSERLKDASERGATVIYNAPVFEGDTEARVRKIGDSALDEIYCTGLCDSMPFFGRRAPEISLSFDIGGMDFDPTSGDVGYRAPSVEGFRLDKTVDPTRIEPLIDTVQFIADSADPRDPVNAAFLLLGLGPAQRLMQRAGTYIKTAYNGRVAAKNQTRWIKKLDDSSKNLRKLEKTKNKTFAQKDIDKYDDALREHKILKFQAAQELGAGRIIDDLTILGGNGATRKTTQTTIDDALKVFTENPAQLQKLLSDPLLFRQTIEAGFKQGTKLTTTKPQRLINQLDKQITVQTNNVLTVNMQLAKRYDDIIKKADDFEVAGEIDKARKLRTKAKGLNEQTGGAAERASNWVRETGARRYYDDLGNLRTDIPSVDFSNTQFSDIWPIAFQYRKPQIFQDALGMMLRSNPETVRSASIILKGLLPKARRVRRAKRTPADKHLLEMNNAIRNGDTGKLIDLLDSKLGRNILAKGMKQKNALGNTKSILGDLRFSRDVKQVLENNAGAWTGALKEATKQLIINKPKFATVIKSGMQMRFHNGLRTNMLVLQARRGQAMALVQKEFADEIVKIITQGAGPGAQQGARSILDRANTFNRLNGLVLNTSNKFSQTIRGTLNPLKSAKTMRDLKNGEVPQSLLDSGFAQVGEPASDVLKRIRRHDLYSTLFYSTVPDLAGYGISKFTQDKGKSSPLGYGIPSAITTFAGDGRTATIINDALMKEPGWWDENIIDEWSGMMSSAEGALSIPGLLNLRRHPVLRKIIVNRMKPEWKKMYLAYNKAYPKFIERSNGVSNRVRGLDKHISETAVKVADEMGIDLNKISLSKMKPRTKRMFLNRLKEKDSTVGAIYERLYDTNLTGGKFKSISQALRLLNNPSTPAKTKIRVLSFFRAQTCNVDIKKGRCPKESSIPIMDRSLKKIEATKGIRQWTSMAPKFDEEGNLVTSRSKSLTEEKYTFGSLIKEYEGRNKDRLKFMGIQSLLWRKMDSVFDRGVVDRVMKSDPELAKKLEKIGNLMPIMDLVGRGVAQSINNNQRLVQIQNNWSDFSNGHKFLKIKDLSTNRFDPFAKNGVVMNNAQSMFLNIIDFIKTNKSDSTFFNDEMKKYFKTPNRKELLAKGIPMRKIKLREKYKGERNQRLMLKLYLFNRDILWSVPETKTKLKAGQAIKINFRKLIPLLISDELTYDKQLSGSLYYKNKRLKVQKDQKNLENIESMLKETGVLISD